MSKQIGQANVLETHEDGTDEWLQQRRKGIGGSDAATVLGHKPYGNDRITLWRRKTGREQPFRGNTATEYGTNLEDYIFNRASTEMHASIDRCESQLQHPRHNWMLANVDGVVTQNGEAAGLAEIKTSTQPAPSEGCKDIHFPQIQHYLGVTGLDRCEYIYFEVPFDRRAALDIASKFIANKNEYWRWVTDQGRLTIRTIERDDEYIRRLIDAEKSFWQSVKTDEPPGDFVPEGVVEVEDDELARLLDQYGTAHAHIKASDPPKAHKESKESAKEAIKQRAQAISAALDDAEEIRIKGTDDVVKWNARGYWMAKPAERDPDEDSDPVVPF